MNKEHHIYIQQTILELSGAERDALASMGMETELTGTGQLPFTAQALGLKNQAQFNPLKFAAHIAKDLKIYENTFVKELKTAELSPLGKYRIQEADNGNTFSGR